MISSLKDTSLAFSIGVMDMVGRGETLIASTTRAFEIYVALSIVYYVIVIILEKYLNLMNAILIAICQRSLLHNRGICHDH